MSYQTRARRSGRGQALVELALIAPVLLVLLVGAAQVGAILYAQVQVDTATREASRIAALEPNGSGAFINGSQNPLGHNCTPSTPSDPNVVCVAARNASGLLDGTQFFISVVPYCTGSSPYSCAQGTSAESCSTTWVDDGGVKTSVSFHVPVFVPLLNALLSDPNKSYRTVSATVTTRVTPCSLNEGK